MSNIKCTKCNNLIPQESAFCPFCGEKVEIKKNEKTCTHCNNSSPLDSEFCPYCGEKIETVTDASLKNSMQIHHTYDNINPTKTRYNFVNTSSEYKRTAAKHIKVLKDEEIILIGDIHKKSASILFWVCTIVYYIACSLFFHFTHIITEKGHWKQFGNINIKESNLHYKFLGFIEYRIDDYYLWWSIVIIIIICLLFFLVPYLIYKVKSKNIIQSELVLTNQHIYYCLSNEEKPVVITLSSIKSIEFKPCTWFKDTHQIKIILKTNVEHRIPGLSNAPEIIDSTMKFFKNKKDNEE